MNTVYCTECVIIHIQPIHIQPMYLLLRPLNAAPGRYRGVDSVITMFPLSVTPICILFVMGYLITGDKNVLAPYLHC
jgi:hypothetical protein